MDLIRIRGARKTYKNGVTAIQDLDLDIKKGEFVFVIGSTGCGKSTLIKMLYREEKPTNGKIIVGGINVGKLRNSKVYKLRRKIGVVFQDFKLLPKLTVSRLEGNAWTCCQRGQICFCLSLLSTSLKCSFMDIYYFS